MGELNLTWAAGYASRLSDLDPVDLLPLFLSTGFESAREERFRVTNGFLDDLPDLWDDEYPRRKGRRKRIPAEPYFPEPRFVDYSAVRQKLVDALMKNEVRRKWQAALTRVFQEIRSYDQRWTDDPDNPFPVEWLKNDLPRVIKRSQFSQFNKLSQEDYSLWRRIVKERTGLNLAKGSDKTLKIFDEKQAEYMKGHRIFYIWEAEKVSRLLGDEDLLCCVLAIYHDHVSEIVEKIISDEIRSIYPDMYDRLVNFTGWLDQAKLETLLVYAEEKGLISETIDNSKKPPAADAEAPEILRKLIPLSPKARLIYEKLSILKVHEAMTTPEILDWLSQEHQKDIDEGTLGKLLKEIKPYGLQNKPRIGYYIPKSS